MPEKLAFQKGVRQRGTVHRHEWLLAASAVLIKGPSDQFLASTAFSADKDGDVLARYAADRLEDLQHLGATADKHVAVGDRGVADGNRDRHIHQPARLQSFDHQCFQLRQIEGFGDIIIGAQLHGLDGCLAARFRRDEDHGQSAIERLDLFEDFQPRHTGQHNIQQHDIGLFG